MEYTTQDVFRHRDNGTICLYNRPLLSAYDVERDAHEFSTSDDYEHWRLGDMEYLGRSSKIVKVDDAKLNNLYYLGGSGEGNYDGSYNIQEIDTSGDGIPFRFCIHNEDIWARHILHVPFLYIENYLDITPSQWEVECLMQDTSGSMNEINKTISIELPKLPKALI